MEERWYSEDELAQMSRPTMDRAIEAIVGGRYEHAKNLCEEMKDEWRFLHDLLVELVAGLISYVQEAQGEDAIEDAWRFTMERSWRRHVNKIDEMDRKDVVRALASSWRAHSTSGVGPHPGAFTITEDDEKFVFTMNPCGSGQRLWRRGLYGPGGYGVVNGKHDWSYNREGFPLYCTHCSFMNELLPIRWIGYPVYPSNPPRDFDHDPCVWYWYKDPSRIPEEHFARYSMESKDQHITDTSAG